MITCHYFRRIIRNSVDADGALPASAQDHVHNCPACRKVYESERGMIRELRGGAGELDRVPSPFLHARIMSSLAGARQDKERKSQWMPAGWAIGLTAACLVALAVIWMRQRAETTRTMTANASRAAAAGSINLSLGMKLPDGNQMRQWAGKLDEPLETEQKLVISDAKTALNALANDFLPEKVRHSLFDEGKGS